MVNPISSNEGLQLYDDNISNETMSLDNSVGRSGGLMPSLPQEGLGYQYDAWVRNLPTASDVDNELGRFLNNLEWVYSEPAIPIAIMLSRIVQAYPELGFSCHIKKLAGDISKKAEGGSSLHFYLIAHILDPDDTQTLKSLILESARLGIWDVVTSLVEKSLVYVGDETFVTRLATLAMVAPHNARLIDMAVNLLDSLSANPSLVTLRVGELIQAQLSRRDAFEWLDPLLWANAIKRTRILVARGFSVAIVQDDYLRVRIDTSKYGFVRPEVFDRIYKHFSFSSTQIESTILPLPSGEIKWIDYQLHSGLLLIFPNQLLSKVATLSGNILSARRHRIGDALHYGPYISLDAGVYSITFLGSVPGDFKYEILVTADVGTTVLASAYIEKEAGAPAEDLLGKLGFVLPNKRNNVEFIFRPMSQSGLVEIMGVAVHRQRKLF